MTLPQNEPAEQGAIGLMLIQRLTLDDLKHYGITVEHFHACKLQASTVLDFLSQGGGDVNAMCIKAAEDSRLEQIGGPAWYIAAAHEAVPGNALIYLKTIRRTHGERMAIRAANMLKHDPLSSEALAMLKKSEREIKAADKLTLRIEFDESAPMDVLDGPSDDLPDPDALPFEFLGMDDGIMYYMPHNGQHITGLSAPSHTRLNMMQITPLQIWEERFPAKNGADWDAAANWMIQTSQSMPKFNARRIRGRGCWIDGGDIVYHAGDVLAVAGQSMPITSYRSPTSSIYESGINIPIEIDNPAKNAEAAKLIELCDMLSWDNPLFGKLLAGWCALAPICGALSWRPHIWVTGSAGTGKTWIMGNIVAPLVGKSALYVQGNTSEAGIRGQLKSDALPVLFDEAESENETAKRRMDGVLELARQASSESGAGIVKGTAAGGSVTYMVRSMFAFSSIGVAAVKKADQSRITSLSLIKSADGQHFAAVKALWRATTASGEYCARLRARAITNAMTTRDNAETFSECCVEFTGDKRSADQIGTLLAGAFSLTSTKRITPAVAHTWLSQQDWSMFAVSAVDSDEMQCMAHLLAAEIRIEFDRYASHMTVGEAIHAADEGGIPNYADHLERIGIKPDPDGVHVANNHPALERIYRETPWAGAKWRGQMLRIAGAQASGRPIRFAGGVIQRAVFLPKKAVFGP